jgi:hypothetical protein
MAEPIAEQIAAAVQTILAGIVAGAIPTGGTAPYHYTPTRVVRFAGFTSDCLDPKPKDCTIYVISPDRRERRLETNRQIESVKYLDLSLATKHVPPTLQIEKPLAADSSVRALKQVRMQADVERALCGSDVTLGLSGIGVYKTEITLWDEDPETTFLDGWAVTYGRLAVTYRHLRGTP